MNYRELLQKYKAGELPEEQRKQVRQDIEKQDAISEYLFCLLYTSPSPRD